MVRHTALLGRFDRSRLNRHLYRAQIDGSRHAYLNVGGLRCQAYLSGLHMSAAWLAAGAPRRRH
jgi:hypothetical protein